MPKRRDGGRAHYVAPLDPTQTTLRKLLAGTSRAPAAGRTDRRPRAGPPVDRHDRWDAPIWFAGDPGVLRAPCVAIVGTRNVSKEGAARARKLARGLAAAGVTVVSGLAQGVDTEALTAALAAGGRVVAVIGTPLDRASPQPNGTLQQLIYERHLLISQFPAGSVVYPSNFPRRNRTMAAIATATAIIEASATSGTLHQAKECAHLGRWLFIARACAEDTSLTWPGSFLLHDRVEVFTSVADVLARVNEAVEERRSERGEDRSPAG